jgi:hypothetical protein
MTVQTIEKAQEHKAQTSLPKVVPARRALPKVTNLDQLRRKTATVPVIAINEGSLLVADGLVLTKKSRPFVHGWTLLEDKRAREIEVDLREGGWHFFYLVPDVQGTGIARSPEGAVRKALEKVCSKGRENGVNALEIAAVSTTSILGLHLAKVVAKLRHIQESPYLFTTTEEMHQRQPVFPEGPDWTTEPWSEIPGIPKPVRIDDRKERNHVQHID